MANDHNYLVRTTEKSLNIVELLVKSGPMGVTEITEELDMAKSTVHNHVNTLQKRGYVNRLESGDYELTFKFLDIGGQLRSRVELFKKSKEVLKSIANKTKETAILATWENGLCVHLYRVNGSKAVDPATIDTYVGLHEHMHNSALGKAILAACSEDEVAQIVDRHGLPATAKNTITDQDVLFDEIESIRETGVAYDDEERINGLRAVAAPILTQQDQVLGSVCITGPRSRLSGQTYRTELPDTVRHAKNLIELRISE